MSSCSPRVVKACPKSLRLGSGECLEKASSRPSITPNGRVTYVRASVSTAPRSSSSTELAFLTCEGRLQAASTVISGS